MNKSGFRSWNQLLLTVFLINLASLSHGEVTPPKNPNSAKGCAICHYRWIDTFFIEGKGSDLVDYTSEKVVATPEMCFSCHDGSVADSRAKVYNSQQHKTNVPAPDDMQTPKIFPLDEQGRIQCATCHSAHGVPSGPDSGETIFMRTSNKNSNMCRMCHPDMTGGPEAGNHPIDKAMQELPRNLIVLDAALGDQKNQMICETCHTAHGSHHESYLIKSGKDSGLCLECHGDKDVFTPDGQRRPVHVINIVPEKSNIPEALIQKGAQLGLAGEIICQTCHKVHNNKIEQQLLLIHKDQKSTLCLTCHADKQYIADTKHDLFLTAPEEKNLAGKTVAQAGVCSACHLPHAAARKLDGNSQLLKGLCLSCHSKGNIAEKALLTGAQHPLQVRPSEKKNKAKLTLPLFSDSGFQDQNGAIACTTCHDPHRWRADSNSGSSANDSKADRTTSFLRKQAPQICRECHPNKFQIANSKHDLSNVAPEERNLRNQTALEAGLCGSCHLVHNARQNYLWARKMAVRTENMAADFCLDCHNVEGAAAKKVIRTPSHPLNISPLENGLSTTLPLFDTAAKRSNDGIMTCQTCHDPHQWNPLENISESHFEVEGNAQNSFLRLQNSPSPKLCASCHPNQGFIEKTDHDLLVTAPFSRNRIGQTPLESGTCGVCHLVHNGQSNIALWAQGFSSGNNIMERMCNSCHSKDGSAKDKIPQIYLHPREKLISNKGKNIKDKTDYFPLFHGSSGERVPVGNISCPSCHNVHQWDSKIFAMGKGSNAEGNLDNSFLRSAASFELCRGCHEADAEDKMKYYHVADKRKFKGIDDLFFQ